MQIRLQEIANLSWVEDHLRIKYTFDSFHDLHVGFAYRLQEVFHLAGTDTMLTGYKSTTICSFFVDNLKEFVNSLLELFFFQVVGALVMVMPRSCSCAIQSMVAPPSWVSPILWTLPV